MSDEEFSVNGLKPSIRSCNAAPPPALFVPKKFWDCCASPSSTWLNEFLAELFGTFILVFIGTCSVSIAVLTSADILVPLVWGFAVAVAIYCTAHVSGAHLNPAVSFAFALLQPHRFTSAMFIRYTVAQVLGAVLAGAINFGIFEEILIDFESKHNITRGQEGSQLSAMILCEYYPNPAVFGTRHDDRHLVSTGLAFAIELLGTAILTACIFALSDKCNNAGGKGREVVPLVIGFTLFFLISLFGPLTQAGLNPARDFGPRLVAAMAGWKDIAFPGPRDGFWVYIIGPLVGAPLGGFVATTTLKRPCNEDEPCGVVATDVVATDVVDTTKV
eukprot:m.269416 g.269416  ORF g.269416 m.269416 type:complete len:331 (+) comp42115_c0_seq1:81-1073(+)